MDTSETYIKMRIAAIPELGMGIPPELTPNTEVTWLTTVVFVDRNGNLYYSTIDEACQLERQDQLQEMVDGGFTHQTFERFYRWYHSGITNLASMEQLWLAFVMKEKHNKVWSGESWTN